MTQHIDMHLRGHWWFLFTLCLALSELQLSGASYRIYICKKELHSYYLNTSEFDLVQGRSVDIIRHGMVSVLPDESLQLSPEEGSGEGSGTLVDTLPTLPAHVDTVAISWHANMEVSYTLEVSQHPEQLFCDPQLNVSSVGTIPENRAAFSITFPCLSSSDTGQLLVNIITETHNSSLNTRFRIEKTCAGFVEPNYLTPELRSACILFPSTSLSSTTPHPSTPLPSSFPPHTSSRVRITRPSSSELIRASPSLAPTPAPILLTTPSFPTTVPPSSSPPDQISPSSTTEDLLSTEDSGVLSPMSASVVITQTTTASQSSSVRVPVMLLPYTTSLSEPSSGVLETLQSTETFTSSLPSSSFPPSVELTESSLSQPVSTEPQMFSSQARLSTPVVVLMPSPPLVHVTPTPAMQSPRLQGSVSIVVASAISSGSGVGSVSGASSSSLAGIITPSRTVTEIEPSSQERATPGSGMTSVVTSFTPAETRGATVITTSPPVGAPVTTPAVTMLMSSGIVLPAPSTQPLPPSTPSVTETLPSGDSSEVASVSSALLRDTDTTRGVGPTRVGPVSPTMAFPQPTVLLPTVIPEIVLNNALRISILEHTAESFNITVQENFRNTTAMVVNRYCDTRPGECSQTVNIPRKRRQVFQVQSSDVTITNIRNNAQGQLEFVMYVQMAGGSQVLLARVLEAAIESGTEDFTSAGFSVTFTRVVPPPPPSEPQLLQILLIAFAPVVGVLLVCIIITVGFIFCVICYRKKPQKKFFSDDPLAVAYQVDEGGEEEVATRKKTDIPISLWMSLPWGMVSGLPSAVQGLIQQFNVDRRSLSILSTTMRGDYGCVVSGQLSIDRTDVMGGTKEVMMKILVGLKRESGKRDEIAKFLEHATLLRGIEHPNIQPVLRVSVEDNCVPLVIYPLAEYGNLHDTLLFCRLTPDQSPLNPVTNQYKVNFALQIAHAMQFLSQNGIVHPDLALRNCLLDSNFTVRVCDGALSQEFYPECYHQVYGAVRPVRWAAIETLQEGLCTVQSNVWSFGVTMWEILTLVEMPYSEVDNNRSILSHLMMGERLSKPDGCPDNLYTLMTDCWKTRGEERPNFATMFGLLKDIYSRYSAFVDSQYSPSPHAPGLEELNFSTFGKNLRQEKPVSIDMETAVRTSGSGYGSGGYPVRHRGSEGGFMRSNRSSQMSGRSPLSNRRISQNQHEKLSLSFSVLSGDVLSGSESETEGEQDHQSHSPLDLNLLPALFTKEATPGARDATDADMELVSSFLGTQSSFMSQHLSSSTVGNASSFSNHQVETELLPPTPSLSPDLTSKTSTVGDETVSMASGNTAILPTEANVNHANADTISKASTLDSLSTTLSAPYPFSCSPSQTSGVHTLQNGTEELKPRECLVPMLDHKARMNGHSAVSVRESASKSTDSGIRSDEEPDSVHTEPETSTNATVNGNSNNHAGVVKRDLVGKQDLRLSEVSRHSRTSQASFGLGISDLSSDLMSTFESWDLSSK